MSDAMSDAREALAHIAAALKREEYETRQRIERMTGLDGDYSVISRVEWKRHFDRFRPMQRQHDELLKLMVTRIAFEVPGPIVIPRP